MSRGEGKRDNVHAFKLVRFIEKSFERVSLQLEKCTFHLVPARVDKHDAVRLWRPRKVDHAGTSEPSKVQMLARRLVLPFFPRPSPNLQATIVVAGGTGTAASGSLLGRTLSSSLCASSRSERR